jgi:predicted enzyme related to lactoylglutathione lyase
MPDSVRAGVLIYVNDLPRLARFYGDVLGLHTTHADADHHVLESADVEIVLHAMPAVVADSIAVPPVLREETAIKPFFTVASLAAAREAAQHLGGAVYEEEWESRGFRIRNAHDPEGNILQVRERL